MAETAASSSAATKLPFQAEVAQLLHLVTHSLYSNKEIFLRELISNASDACDKLRFEALDKPALYEDQPTLEVRVSFDKAAKTITIADNGIGLTQQEAIDNLGTIAKSGTKDFMSKLSGDQKANASEQGQLIGQFGVGFYSGFIVADRISVESRRAGAPANEGVRWVSGGAGRFRGRAGRAGATWHRCHAAPARRCGGIPQRLEAEADHRQIFRPHQLADPDGKGRVERRRADQPIGRERRSPARRHGKNRRVGNGEQSQRPVDATQEGHHAEQYIDFYKQISHDSEAPLAWAHNRVEGSTEYTQLLYIPAKAPYDLWNRDTKAGVKLYVKRVFIMDEAEALLPSYLRFVKGVIDSADLPLNVSRELLQESRDVRAIREGSTKRVLSMLEDLARHEKKAVSAGCHCFYRSCRQRCGRRGRQDRRS